MIPGKNDPRWMEIVTTTKEFPLTALASKMLVMRVRTMTKLDQSPQKIVEAISIAHDFFSKNEEMLRSDVEILFGKN